jgi:hypothetical protein
VWRVAPFVAALGLLLALGVRWMGWPAAVVMGVLLIGLAALVAYGAIMRRDRGVSDAMAARVDAEAGLGGELRSANWFAAAERPTLPAGSGSSGRGSSICGSSIRGSSIDDAWVDLHVSRAADRLQAVEVGRHSGGRHART